LKKDQGVLTYGEKLDQIQGKLEAVLGVHVNLESKRETMESDLSQMVRSLQRLTIGQQLHRDFLQRITIERQHHWESLHWLTAKDPQNVSSCRLLHHFEAQEETALTLQEKYQLEDLDERMMKLSHSPRWATIRSRMVR
jgi:hypothetical protein